MSTRVRTLAVIALAVLLIGLMGCGTTQAQKTGSGGAAIGAGVGGLLGGWGGAAAGAAIGGGVGYLVGNEQDKKAAEQQAAGERESLQKSRITEDPSTAHRPASGNALVGSTWRVISYVNDNEVTPEYSSMIVTFQTNTRITTLMVLADGTTDTVAEHYRVVGNALIISGKNKNGKGYVVNAEYSIENKQMIVVAPGIRVVLEEIEERV